MAHNTGLIPDETRSPCETLGACLVGLGWDRASRGRRHCRACAAFPARHRSQVLRCPVPRPSGTAPTDPTVAQVSGGRRRGAGAWVAGGGGGGGGTRSDWGSPTVAAAPCDWPVRSLPAGLLLKRGAGGPAPPPPPGRPAYAQPLSLCRQEPASQRHL